MAPIRRGKMVIETFHEIPPGIRGNPEAGYGPPPGRTRARRGPGIPMPQRLPK